MATRPTSTPTLTPALFLDRDGVINVDHGYVHTIEQFEFVLGIFALARFASETLHWPVVVVTNQSGIGRGYYNEAQYQSLTDWMCDRFRAEGTVLAKVYHCPYHPQAVGTYRSDHAWRKPRPGMFLQAAIDLDLDLRASIAIGDRDSDIDAARAAGIVHCIKLDARSPDTARQRDLPYRRARDLTEALDIARHHGREYRGGSTLTSVNCR